MDTLRSLRTQERIVQLNDILYEKSKTAYVTVALERHDKDCILVFTQHSEDIVDVVLHEIDPEDSGRVFFASEIIIDPINNKMVPKHRLATQDELDNLAKRNIPLSKLPILRMLDPIRRWHNFPKNSVVAIERTSGSQTCPSGDMYFRRCT